MDRIRTSRATGTQFRMRSPDAHPQGKKEGWRVDDVEGKEHCFAPTRHEAYLKTQDPGSWSTHAKALIKAGGKPKAEKPAKKAPAAKKEATPAKKQKAAAKAA
jgi:hypothetical protein